MNTRSGGLADQRLALCAAIAAVCGMFGGGCSPEPCFGSSVGKQYRVTVVERWDENSRFSGGHYSPFPCPDDFDLSPGSSFVVSVDHFNMEASTCSCGSGNVTEGPAGWSWTESTEVGPCKGSFFQGGGLATRDACRGRLKIDIEAKALPSGSSIEGQAPLAWAQRGFEVVYDAGGTTTCPVAPSCGDRFVVEIAER